MRTLSDKYDYALRVEDGDGNLRDGGDSQQVQIGGGACLTDRDGMELTVCVEEEDYVFVHYKAKSVLRALTRCAEDHEILEQWIEMLTEELKEAVKSL